MSLNKRFFSDTVWTLLKNGDSFSLSSNQHYTKRNIENEKEEEGHWDLKTFSKTNDSRSSIVAENTDSYKNDPVKKNEQNKSTSDANSSKVLRNNEDDKDNSDKHEKIKPLKVTEIDNSTSTTDIQNNKYNFSVVFTVTHFQGLKVQDKTYEFKLEEVNRKKTLVRIDDAHFRLTKLEEVDQNIPLFVYGTLMSPAVRLALLNRNVETELAFLKGFHRYKIENQVFPAILPIENNDSISKTIVNYKKLSSHNYNSNNTKNICSDDNDTNSTFSSNNINNNVDYNDGTETIESHVNTVSTIKEVEGLLLTDLTPRELEILDLFEDDDYRKIIVSVTVPHDVNTSSTDDIGVSKRSYNNTDSIATQNNIINSLDEKYITSVHTALLYCWTLPKDYQGSVLFGEWDFNFFAPEESDYVTMCEDFKEQNFVWSDEEFSD
eukprot:Awhi_evm1s1354